MKIALQIGGVLAWGLFTFLAVFYLSFPSDAVADRLAFEAQERMGMALDVEKPKPKGLTGVRFKSLELGQIQDGQPPKALLSMGKTWVKVKPLAAMAGNYDVRFDGVIYEGHAKGNVQYNEEKIVADVNLEELKVNAFPLQGEMWTVVGGGTFDGEIDLELDQEDITQSEGEVSFSFDGLSFREGTSFYGMGFETAFEEAGGFLEIKNGRANVQRTRFRSDKLEGDITGYISLKDDLMKSRLALKVSFKLLDDTLNQLLAFKFGDDPAHKDDKGVYHYLLSGSLESPRFREDKTGARRAGVRGKGGRAGRNRDPEDRQNRRSRRLDDMTEEERAEWESEREKRREELRQKREERRQKLDEERQDGRSGRVDRKDQEFSGDVRTGGVTARGRDMLPPPRDGDFVEGDMEGGDFVEGEIIEDDFHEDEFREEGPVHPNPDDMPGYRDDQGPDGDFNDEEGGEY